MLILKLIRGTTVLLYKFAAKQKKELKLGVFFFGKNELQVGMGL